MLRAISTAERTYITSGCNFDIRTDGRGADDYRNVVIENNVFPQANGSSRVRLGDTVDVMCSVKVSSL
jgi:exosome complex component RRP42